jgi:hypothetical protein
MNEITQYILVILSMGLLAGAWMGVQILAKRMNIKNHIDDASGCCGACSRKEECDKNQEIDLATNSN